MANAIYPKFKEAILKGDIAGGLDAVDVKLILVDLADYTYSAAHDFLDDVPAAARVDTSAALGSKTFTSGVFDAADTSFVAASGDVSEAVIVYHDSGVEATSFLIAYYDTGVTGLPVTPNGGDINVAFDAAGLFTL